MTIRVPKIDGIRVSTRVLSKICRGVRERLRVGIEGGSDKGGLRLGFSMRVSIRIEVWF